MNREDATVYRALVARANYLAPDRTDIAFAVKGTMQEHVKPQARILEGHEEAGKVHGRKARDSDEVQVPGKN